MNKYSFKIIILMLALVTYRQALAQQIRNTYRFYNTLSTTEPACAEDLIPTKGLNLECQSSTAPAPGQFISDTLSLSNTIRRVYHNNLNWGLKYLNTAGVIGNTYTVQIYLKIVNFNEFYTRIIDFSDGVEDNGIYFTNYNTPPPSTERCLNFYPNGNFGVCPFFNSNTYYFLTITRSDLTKLIDIYVNDQLFTSYNDSAGFYVSAMGKPVHIFRDDPIGFACEDGEANFAYLSFANYYSTQADVFLTYQNLNSIVNTADFSVSPSPVCTGTGVNINYTGNIPANASQYIFNCDWNGGDVISGSGRGPYVVDWNSTGTKTITLNISGGCASSVTNSKQISVKQIYSQIDTSICIGTFFEGYSVHGTYIDTFPGASGCDSIRTINLTVITLQTPGLGNLQTLCSGDSLLLSPGNYESYLWQDGSTEKTYAVKKAGLYSVIVANKCSSAKAEVQVNEVSCGIYFPKAFSPNKDARNEFFKILTDNVLSGFYLVIYNRYGEKVFESTKPVVGWDGKYNGQDADAGVYVWRCSFKKTNMQQPQFLQGTVILLR